MELLKDLIPVICDLINSVRAEHPDSEIESADIAHKLIRLEELDDRFEDLALVAEMKRVIADVVPEGKNGVALRPRKGLEPLRNRLLGTVAEAVGGLSNEDVLQAILFKKARPGGGFSLFNFDDMPEFESLDSVTSMLQQESEDTAPLDRLLKMDMDDLVEHPLWHQLLELLFRKLALSRRHSQFRLKLLRVYLRLCSGLLNSPAQAVEAMCGVVVHWTQRLVAARSGPAIGSPLSQKDLRRMMQADPELNLFVMLLNCILRDSASVLEAPGFHKEGDVLVFLALYVIAHGTLIYSETEGPNGGVRDVSMYNIVCCLPTEATNWLESLSQRWSALGMYLHSIKSGFCGCTYQRLLDYTAVLKSASAADRQGIALAWVVSVKLLLQVSLPYAGLQAVRDSCVQATQSCGMYDPDTLPPSDYGALLEYYKSKFIILLNKKVNGFYPGDDFDSAPPAAELLKQISLNDAYETKKSLWSVMVDKIIIDNLFSEVFVLHHSTELSVIIRILLKHFCAMDVKSEHILLRFNNKLVEMLSITSVPLPPSLEVITEILFADISSYQQFGSSVPCAALVLCSALARCIELRLDLAIALSAELKFEYIAGVAQMLVGVLHFRFCIKGHPIHNLISTHSVDISIATSLSRMITEISRTLDGMAANILVCSVNQSFPQTLLENNKELPIPPNFPFMSECTGLRQRLNHTSLQQVLSAILLGESFLSVKGEIALTVNMVLSSLLQLVMPDANDNICDEFVVDCIKMLLCSAVVFGHMRPDDLKEQPSIITAAHQLLENTSCFDQCGIRSTMMTQFRDSSSAALSSIGSYISNLAWLGETAAALDLLGRILDRDGMPMSLSDAFYRCPGEICATLALNYPLACFCMRVIILISWNIDVMVSVRELADLQQGSTDRTRKRPHSDTGDYPLNSQTGEEEARGFDEFTIFQSIIDARLSRFGTTYELGLCMATLPNTTNELDTWTGFRQHPETERIEVKEHYSCETDVNFLHDIFLLHEHVSCRAVILSFWRTVGFSLELTDELKLSIVQSRTTNTNLTGFYTTSRMICEYSARCNLFGFDAVETLSQSIVSLYAAEATSVDNFQRLGFILLCLLSSSDKGVINFARASRLLEVWRLFDKRALVTEATRLLSGYNGGVIFQSFIAASLPVQVLMQKVICDYFLNWLPLCDVLYIFAMSLCSDDVSNIQFPARVAAAFVIKVHECIVSDMSDWSFLGGETFIECVRSSISKYTTSEGSFLKAFHLIIKTLN